MNRLLCFFVFLSAAIVLPITTFSQYILNGNATQESCNCYSLTEAKTVQSGSVWQQTKIDLNTPFDFSFNVFVGCLDATGADGIVFMLQPISASLGGSGGGMGFEGVTPSIGIALDTWQNTQNNDPAYDHISIQANGVIKHGNDLAGPIPVSAASDNIEDCAWHVLRITWDPGTHILSAYFDGVFRLSTQTDLVTNIFKNDPMVYWGFSAATGGNFNVQKFCTALNPVYNSGTTNDAVCFGTPVNFQDNSVSFTTVKNYFWDFGDGTSSILANPPPHNYAQPGRYQVKHTITAADGCVSETLVKTIKVGDKPKASFQIFDTCESLQPRMEINTTVNVGNINQWKWTLDGADIVNVATPELTKLVSGNHSLNLTVTSDIGCVSDVFAADFVINPTPAVAFDTNDGCINVPVLFTGRQTDNFTTINSWHWNFGDMLSSDQETINHVYTKPGNYPLQLTATASNGCVSNISKNIFINSAHAFAGNDTLVIPNTIFQLNGTGGSVYSWWPSTGLSDANISNPMVNISDDIKYVLTVKTAEGCTDTAIKKITVFKGSAVYVPTAFTPNNDGLNDILKPLYVGIKSLSYFTVYNRWGQKIFSTSDMNKGWNGYMKGNLGDTGSYAWVLKAVDIAGKVYNLKGAFVLVK
jgi:gliding motility-associated-like protein